MTQLYYILKDNFLFVFQKLHRFESSFTATINSKLYL